MQRKRGVSTVKVLAVVLVCAAVVVALLWAYGSRRPPHQSLIMASRGIGKALWLLEGDPPETVGTEWVVAGEIEGVSSMLDGDDPDALHAALRAAEVKAIATMVDDTAEGDALRMRFRRLDRVDPFRGDHLGKTSALYALPDRVEMTPLLERAVAGVARGILSGKAPPRIESFPQALRERGERREIIVILSKNGRPRLWRSARSQSIAKGLLTAAAVARQRWAQKRQSMGRDLDDALKSLTIDVAVLEVDGILDARDVAFVDQHVGESHGIGFERMGKWHYTLPQMRQEDRSPAAELEALFQAQGFRKGGLTMPDNRPYRFVVRVLATSRPPPRPEL